MVEWRMKNEFNGCENRSQLFYESQNLSGETEKNLRQDAWSPGQESKPEHVDTKGFEKEATLAPNPVLEICILTYSLQSPKFKLILIWNTKTIRRPEKIYALL